MKKLLIIAVSLLALAGCSSAAAQEQSDQSADSAVVLKAVRVENMDMREMTGALTLPGKVAPDELSVVSSLVSGQVKTLSAEVGDIVEAGQTLAKIDDEFVRLQKEQAEIGNQLYDLSLQSARRGFERTKALYESGSTTKVEYDSAADMLTRAKLDYARGKNSVSQMAYQLEHMTIAAPIDGYVSEAYLNEGESVGPGTPMFEIVSIDQVVVEAGVTEKDVNRLKAGQVVRVDIPAAGQLKEGVVVGVGPVPGQGGTYPVRVRIQNETGEVKPGMYAELKIETDTARPVLAVPKIAVMHESGEDYVFVSNGQTAQRRTIKKGIAFDSYFEVLSGLELNDRIVVSGQAYLSDGDQLDIIE